MKKNETVPVNELTVEAPESGQLGSTAVANDTELTWSPTGNAEGADRPVLGRVLNGVHDQMKARGLRQVRVDLRDLLFMSSSCFKDFVTWLMSIQALPPEQRYKVHFITHPGRRWQRTGIPALASFAVDLVTLE